MINLLIFILACYGTSNILAFGSIFEWWRNLLSKLGTGPLSLHKLFTCMMCLPTWVGFLFSVILQDRGFETPFYSVDGIWLGVFLDGILASGSVYAINALVDRLEREED